MDGCVFWNWVPTLLKRNYSLLDLVKRPWFKVSFDYCSLKSKRVQFLTLASFLFGDECPLLYSRLMWLYWRFPNVTNSPSLGRVISSAHVKSSSKVCVDSTLKERRTWDNTIFSSIRANRWPVRKKKNKVANPSKPTLRLVRRRL